ncbi:MAG: hypothetical protein KIT10_01995 [Flavobacteriales bacterium]|nr:hypothetical protein [Flavobacteriales bacterium]
MSRWRISAVFGLPLLLGVGLGVLLWEHLKLPYSNPLGIPSQVSLLEYSPANNSLRFGVLVLLPALLLLSAWRFLPLARQTMADAGQAPSLPLGDMPEHGGAGRWLVLTAMVLSLLSPTSFASGPFDSFHEGESLGPAVGYARGEVPYRDHLFIHGTWQDPLRSVVAFKLFGRSIGAVRALESFTKVAIHALLALLLLRLFPRNTLHAAVVLLAIQALAIADQLDIMTRDLPTLLALLALARIALEVRDHDLPAVRPPRIAMFMLGLLPGLALGVSVDRGLYLTLFLLVIAPITLWLLPKRSRRATAMFLLAGLITGTLLLGLMIRWNYTGMFQFCFGEMPLYKELMDSYPYSILSPRYLACALLAALLPLALLWVFLATWRERPWPKAVERFLRDHLFTLGLVMLALLLFRNALGRADALHLKYSWWGLFLAALVFFRAGIPLPFTATAWPAPTKRLPALLAPALIVLSLVTVTVTGQWRENFPWCVADEAFIPAEDREAVAWLRENLGQDEGFITLTGEAAWYYYLDRPCPTRFNVIQFAQLPHYQDEVIALLESGDIQWLLYTNGHWYNTLDHHDNDARIPRIMAHIRQHYKPHVSLGHNEIWALAR